MKKNIFITSLIAFILSSCNLYELAGDNTNFSDDFQEMVENKVLEFSPHFHDFGAASGTITVQVKNIGDFEVTSLAFSMGAPDFSHSTGGTPCGSNLSPGDSCQVDVTFTRPSTPDGDKVHGTLDANFIDDKGQTRTNYAYFEGIAGV